MLNVPFDSNLIEIFVQHSAMINRKTDLLHYFINTRLDSLLSRNKLFITFYHFSPQKKWKTAVSDIFLISLFKFFNYLTVCVVSDVLNVLILVIVFLLCRSGRPL